MTRSSISFLALALATCFLAQIAGAQPVTANDGPQIVRDASDLQRRVAPAPEDPDAVDTALVFSNSGFQARVLCKAFNANGAEVGRAWVKVPRLGLRLILASDFANGADFVGTAQCATQGHVTGSAILIAPSGLTNLNVRQGDHTGDIRIRFPVVATY